MAGLEADVSSYNQPLPVSPMETVKNLAGIQQQKINIDKSKLDLMATQFGLMNNELANLIDSNATKPQAAERLARISKTLNLPPEATNHMMEELNQAPDVKTFAKFAIRRGMSTMEKYGVQLGTNEDQNDGSTKYQGVRQSPEKGGGFVPGTQSAVQPPPTQPNVDNSPKLPTGQPNPNYLQPGIIGPSAAPGFAPAGRLPVAAPAPISAAPTPLPTPRPGGMPVARPTAPAAVSGASGPTVQTGHNFAERFAGDSRIATGAPPGVAEAIKAVGEQSGKDYATDLNRAKNFQADLYPAQAALQGIKELGTQGVGPGTETLNNIKSAIITWLPDADKKLIDGVGTFEQTRKYLTQIARSNGSTGTNDQLAAAFEANPNIKMSNAATETLLKSVIALRKMQQAQTLLFGKQGLPESQYSKWISENQNTLDPRAFGWDDMSGEARKKLITHLGKDPEAYKKFEDSLTFANEAGLIEPPARKK